MRKLAALYRGSGARWHLSLAARGDTTRGLDAESMLEIWIKEWL